MRRFSIILAALLLFPAGGLASPDRAGMGSSGMAGSGLEVQTERFKKMDNDNNGSLSKEEFLAAFPSMHEAAFSAIDSDADNAISLEEWLTFSNMHSRDMRESGMGQGGMPPAGMGGMPPAGMGGKAQPGQSGHDTQGRPLFELAPKK